MIEAYEQGSGAEGTSVKEQTRHLKEEALRTTGNLVTDMQQRVRRLASEEKDNAANRLTAAGNALHEAASRLQQDELLSGYTNQFADKLQEFADDLRRQDLESIANRITDFARRRPELFLAGTFLLGVLAARLLKSRPPVGE